MTKKIVADKTPAQKFLDLIRKHITGIRRDRPKLIDMGEKMADALMAGGTIFPPPVAPFWVGEFSGRAGGLRIVGGRNAATGKASRAKDLAYFLTVEADVSEESVLLHTYHQALSSMLALQGDEPPSFEALQTSVELAICDWRRFSEVGLGGWGDSGATRRVQKVLDRLGAGRVLGSEEAYIDAVKKEFPI